MPNRSAELQRPATYPRHFVLRNRGVDNKRLTLSKHQQGGRPPQESLEALPSLRRHRTNQTSTSEAVRMTEDEGQAPRLGGGSGDTGRKGRLACLARRTLCWNTRRFTAIAKYGQSLKPPSGGKMLSR